MLQYPASVTLETSSCFGGRNLNRILLKVCLTHCSQHRWWNSIFSLVTQEDQLVK
jgi:hypothetical protein